MKYPLYYVNCTGASSIMFLVMTIVNNIW